MPTKPPSACPCGGRRTNGVCDRCGPKRRQESRTADVKHFNNVMYGRRWKEFRLQYLRAFPLCQDCSAAGIVAAATEVHHLTKVKDDAGKQYDHDNLLALCKSHHSARTMRGE